MHTKHYKFVIDFSHELKHHIIKYTPYSMRHDNKCEILVEIGKQQYTI